MTDQTITPDQVVHSDYLADLGTDWVAVDASGHVVVRAGSEAACRKALPGAAGFFTGHHFNKPPKHPHPNDQGNTADLVGADIGAAMQAAHDLDTGTAGGATFDHDHDGKVGGSLPKHKTTKAK